MLIEFIFSFVFGLLIGSFLNVVIYRLPIMMHNSWRQECLIILENPPEEVETFNLMLPRSHCTHCQQKIAAIHNIPIISYLVLRGRCAMCHFPIALRYPFIEVLTGILTVFLLWHFGATTQWIAALLLTYALIAITFIDYDTQLIPDAISLPLIWIGLLLNVDHIFTSLDSAVIGAIAGYSSLWLFTHSYYLFTNKVGMGQGDFKLFALFGAWLGWQMLPLILVLSSFVGAIIGIGMIISKRASRDTAIPFGPYLAIAGWLAMLYGNHINQFYLHYVH